MKTLRLIKCNEPGDNEKLLKYKEIFDELSSERMDEIYILSKQIDFKILTYKFKSKNIAPINFISFRGPLNIYENIKNGNISIEKVKKD